ncbi:Uncharacterised protein [Mycobacterium tuberculosis]|nr:Uncharacterised protein [Mycobacterium tuberculosis]
MGEHRAFERFLVDKIHRLAAEEVESVQILRVGADHNFLGNLFDLDHGLEQIARAFLNELSHGMKIC